MAKDIVTKAEILGGEIDVRANFGQTVKVTVSPDPYMGDTEVTPSAETQVLATKKKFVQDDITVLPAPTETLSTTSNGQFTPSSGKVGFSAVTVDVNPDLRPLSVSENGQYSPDGFDGYSSVTADIEPNLETLNVTENGLYLPESGVDGFDRVNVDVPQPSGSTTITENGTYNVEQYASAVVDVPTGGFPSYDDVVLPSEYQRVEYIESSGTQYINLPYGFLPTDFVQIKSAIAMSENIENYMVAASQWNTNNNRFAMAGIGRGGTASRPFGSAIGNRTTSDGLLYGILNNDGNVHEFVYRDGLFISPDINSACGFSTENGLIFGSETTNIRLFFGWDSPTKGKIAYYVHEKADGRKLALFACYRKSDGVIGMYDVENDVFYTNDGSGDFTKGQDI